MLTATEVTKLLRDGAHQSDSRLQEPLEAAERQLVDSVQRHRVLRGAIDVNDSGMLRRFLIARELHVDQTLEMLRHRVRWTEANLPISFTPELVSELRKGKSYSNGFDAEGRPLLVVRAKYFDPRKRDMDTAIMALMHSAEEAIRSLPAGQTQISVLYDRSGFSFAKNADFGLLINAIKLLSAIHPERLANFYVYPTGVVAKKVLSAVKVFLKTRSLRKVKMVSSSEKLAELVPRQYLSPELGGTSTFVFNPAVYQIDEAFARTTSSKLSSKPCSPEPGTHRPAGCSPEPTEDHRQTDLNSLFDTSVHSCHSSCQDECEVDSGILFSHDMVDRSGRAWAEA